MTTWLESHDGVRGEALDVVQLGEEPVAVGGAVALELLLGLLPEVAAVHQEEHPARAAVLDEPVDGRDGGDRLARAGRHLDQRAGAVLLEGTLEVRHRLDLVRVERVRIERRQRLQARAEGGGPRVVGGGVEAARRRAGA